jgi:alpha-D-xyloside xylohydrolase
MLLAGEHYASQEELLEAAQGYRNRSIPVDNIVQDWLYWGSLGWGAFGGWLVGVFFVG